MADPSVSPPSHARRMPRHTKILLGLIAGLSTRRSAELASAAASVVVRRLGVAVATPDEIVEALRFLPSGEPFGR